MGTITKPLIIVAVVILGIIIGFFVVRNYLSNKAPIFTIVSHNDEPGISYDKNFNPIYNHIVYVKIKNTGISGSKTVHCEITRYDLTTFAKSALLYLESDEERIVDFFFSHQDLNGKSPTEYKVWID